MRTGSKVASILGLLVLALLGAACSSPQDPPGTDGTVGTATATTTTPTATPSPTVTASSAPTTTATSSAPPATSSAAPVTSSAPGKKLSKEGEICGGIAGFMCEPGLVCSMTKPAHPDQAGKCQKP